MITRKFTLFVALFLCFSIFVGQIPPVLAQTKNVSYAALSKGQKINGFRAESVYLNDNDQPFGARLIHERTGFTLDLLQIQSVPQSFLWVKTYTVSDMGEPHTQEHLLIGKGNKGRNVNSTESMSMGQSNASTFQTFTNYQMNTSGGAEVFYNLFGEYVDALLNPDYTDEEIRREVRNWGVTENADKTLRLEEKGSVYNEMVSSTTQPGRIVYIAGKQMVYGANHPMSYNAGGSPEGIREMQPDDIKRYHAANYHLGNMGAVISVPKEMTVDAVTSRLDAIFQRVEPKTEKREFMTEAKLPAKTPAEPGKIRTVEFPSKNEQQPAMMMFAYPATLELDLKERLLLDNFLTVFAGDANTNLYKKLVDSKTREIDLGAQGVFAYSDDFPGNPVSIGLNDVAATNLTEEKAALVRQKIMEEFARVAAFPDNSPELKEFNERFRNALVDYRRSLSKFVNTPPGFGFRSGSNGYGWFWQTAYLNETNDFRKSVTLKPEVAEVEKMLAGGKNFWRDYLTKWKFTETKPYGIVARANPKMIEQAEREAKTRADAEVENLKKKYAVADAQAAIRRYREEYDKTSAELEKLEQTSTAKFIENPPLTLDDQLDYKEASIGGVKLVSSYFDSMTGATSGVALRLDVVPENELVYVSSLPALLRLSGVVKDGKALSYEEMSELLRKEILNLNVDFTGNERTNRYELVLRGAGNDAAESLRAVEWMKTLLQNPNWRRENLPRLRDVVDQQLGALRRRMQGAEESWVNNPALAYLKQDSPLYLATSSFLTQTHNVQRLRWMLKEAGDAENARAIDGFLTKLAAAKGNRDELKTMLAAMQGDTAQTEKVSAGLKPLFDDFGKLPEAARALATETAKDLNQNLTDIPDSSLAADWAYLANQIRQDLAQSPDKTLADLDGVRQKLLKTGNARMFFVGSRDMQARLDPAYKNLLAGFENGAPARATYSNARRIEERLRTRGAATEKPVFVGLMAPNMTGGVFINEAPLTAYTDLDREKLLDFLASKLYGGGGAHSVFSKTIGAGLAYSNGIGSNPASGIASYYAERTPELPQTLRFVIDELKRAPQDNSLTEYAIALVFSSRAPSPYEARGEAMASNLADGVTPETVAKFRRGVLELRKMPNLADELYKRKDKVYGRVLPGFNVKGKDVAGASYFAIGSEKQMAAYEAYLKTADAPETKLYRLYPRDFWLVSK
ncbi:MAG TPA: insulinase family protein [Pyrinomonadaceae bacterium]|jgi:Zn-dependent M16 (insulinase) family peptidase